MKNTFSKKNLRFLDPTIRTSQLLIIFKTSKIYLVLTPASNNFEDLEFDKLTLKMFDPSTEKKYNLFRISYFKKMIPKVIYFFAPIFGLYTLTTFIVGRNIERTIFRLLVLIYAFCMIPFTKTNFFQLNFYKITRVTIFCVIGFNFLYCMVSNADHSTYNFILIMLFLTYNLNVGYVFSLFVGILNIIFFFIRFEEIFFFLE